MRVFVDSNIISSESGILIDTDSKKYSRLLRPPQDAWVYEQTFKSTQCFDALLEINKQVIDTGLPQKYLEVIRALHIAPNNIKLRWFFNKADYKSFVKKIITNVETVIPLLDTEYYNTVYKPTQVLFDSLKCSTIDEEKLQKYLAEEVNPNQISALKTFENPVPVQYDRFKSRTGRLITAAGPNMLLLRKEYRNVLKSRYEGGEILYLDYSALETRAMLEEAGREVGEKDIYAQLAIHLFEGNLSRDQTKEVVLSLLYGMADLTLAHKLDMQLGKLREFILKLNKFFRKSEVVEHIKKRTQDGYVRTRFGRRVQGDQLKDGEINTYFQSTGVDIATLGFTNIINLIQEEGLLIHPLFVLHDALIVDAHPGMLKHIARVKTVGTKIPGYVSHFPIKVETINE